MNILEVQDKLKNLSEDQLVQEMQSPSGTAPQFLVLSEIQRRQRMRAEFNAQKAQAPTQTVAEEAVATAGIPQAAAGQMAKSLAPQTAVAQNTGIASLPTQAPQKMAAGGMVRKMAEGTQVRSNFADQAVFTDPAVRAMANRVGMSVQDYLDSLEPREADRIRASAEARASRDRFISLDAATPSPTEPTQSDLDHRFADTFLIDTRGVNKPATETDSGFPTQEGRIIGADDAPFQPAPLPSLAAPDAPATYEQDAVEMLNGMPQEVTPPAPAVGPDPSLDRRAQFEPSGDGLGLDMLPPEVDPEYYARQTMAARPITQVLADAVPTIQSPEQGRADIEALRKAQIAADRAAMVKDFPQKDELPPSAPAVPPAAKPPTAAPTEDAPIVAVVAPPGGGSGGGSGGAGGGAGGGGAGASGPMSSYEQELMNALKRSEARAEQDKWLALAQVGLQMMASTNPNVFGALGEGGLAGLETYRGSRDQAEKERLGIMSALNDMDMQRQKMALARAGGSGGSGGGRGGLTANQQLNAASKLVESANDRLLSVQTTGTEQEKLDAKNEYDAAVDEYYRVYNLYRNMPVVAESGEADAIEDVPAMGG